MKRSHLRLAMIPDCDEAFVEIFVDGENLGAKLCAALHDAGFDDCLPWFGGDYQLSDTIFGPGVLGKGADNAILFACGCTFSACSSTRASVRVTSDADLMEIANIHTQFAGEERFAPVDPIRLSLSQVRQEVDRIEDVLQQWRKERRN